LEASGVGEVLPLVVQIVSPAGRQVNRGPVFAGALAQGLVILWRIHDPPATQMKFKQKQLQLLVWVTLPVSVLPCHQEKIERTQKLHFDFSTG
jgi:hypothetical protein